MNELPKKRHCSGAMEECRPFLDLEKMQDQVGSRQLAVLLHEQLFHALASQLCNLAPVLLSVPESGVFIPEVTALGWLSWLLGEQT